MIAHVRSATMAKRLGLNAVRRRKRVMRKVRKNPLTIINPMRGARLLYHGNVELRGRRAVGQYRGQLFKHPFASRAQVEVLGLKDGSVLLRSRTGTPLWGYVE